MYLGGEDAGFHFHIVWVVESMGSVGDVSGNHVCILELLVDVAQHGYVKGAVMIIPFEAYPAI